MSLPVVTIAEDMKEKKRINPKIGMGHPVKTKVGKIEENTREGRSRRLRREVVVYVQSMVRKKKFLFLFEDEYKKDISSC